MFPGSISITFLYISYTVIPSITNSLILEKLLGILYLSLYLLSTSDIKFEYRTNDLPRDLIFLSASFKGNFKNKDKAKRDIEILKEKKGRTQPTKVKTGGSTFKNPKNQTKQKVWELIKSSVPLNTSFGDAVISKKHSNFFINKNKATYEDMKKLIDFVKNSVREKTGINLDLEIEIVG